MTTPPTTNDATSPTLPRWLRETNRVIRAGDEHEVSYATWLRLEAGNARWERTCPGCFLVKNAEAAFTDDPEHRLCNDCV